MKKITLNELKRLIKEELSDIASDSHDPYQHIAELASDIEAMLPDLEVALNRLKNTTASDMEGLGGGLDETNEVQVQLENIKTALDVLEAQGWTAA